MIIGHKYKVTQQMANTTSRETCGTYVGDRFDSLTDLTCMVIEVGAQKEQRYLRPDLPTRIEPLRS